MRDLSGYGEDRDLNVAIENFPKPLFGCDPRELYHQISALGLPNVGMCLDIGHAFVGGHLPAVLSEFGEKIFSVHASDNRGRVDEHMTPGQGVVPWEEIITGLRQLDFRGPFVVEVRDGRRFELILNDIIGFADKMGLSGVGQLSHCSADRHIYAEDFGFITGRWTWRGKADSGPSQSPGGLRAGRPAKAGSRPCDRRAATGRARPRRAGPPAGRSGARLPM